MLLIHLNAFARQVSLKFWELFWPNLAQCWPFLWALRQVYLNTSWKHQALLLPLHCIYCLFSLLYLKGVKLVPFFLPAWHLSRVLRVPQHIFSHPSSGFLEGARSRRRWALTDLSPVVMTSARMSGWSSQPPDAPFFKNSGELSKDSLSHFLFAEPPNCVSSCWAGLLPL